MMSRKSALCTTVLAALWAAAAFGAASSGQDRAQEAGRSLIGKPAPRLVLTTIEGAKIDLANRYGKQAVYLKFWATWCVPCRQQMPHFEHTYETAGADLAVIAINVGFNDSLDAVRDYQRKLGITMPIVIDDGRAAAAFNLRVTPQHIVIGRDGRVQYVGHLADEQLEAALAAARTAPAGPAGHAADAPALHAYHVGDQLAPQAPHTLEGPRFPLRDPKSQRPTLLVFLSPWCESYLETTRPAVSANCRRTREQVASLSDDAGVRWLGIASGLWASPDDLREYRAKYAVRIPLSLDASGAMFREFSINEVPAVLVVDHKGMILRRLEARDLESAAALHAALESPAS
jgi:thiol-disulfide isomerase/thioredoxin